MVKYPEVGVAACPCLRRGEKKRLERDRVGEKERRSGEETRAEEREGSTKEGGAAVSLDPCRETQRELGERGAQARGRE